MRKNVVSNGALAAWDIVELRCRRLKENFYAALCRNESCDLGKYRMTKPDGVELRSKPVYASRSISGMGERKKVLVPIACICQAKTSL